DSNCCDVISVPSSTDFVSFEALLFSVLLSISAWMGCCTVSLLLSFSNILLKFESLLVFSLSTLGGISFTSCCYFCKVSACASSLCLKINKIPKSTEAVPIVNLRIEYLLFLLAIFYQNILIVI